MSSKRFCPACKQLNNMMAIECVHCGAPLPPPTEGFGSSTVRVSSTQSLPTSDRLPPSIELDQNTFALVVVDKEPVILSERKEVILGRETKGSQTPNLIDLSSYSAMDLGVSRKHLKITPKEQDQSFTVQDLASTNGSWLNSVRLLPDKQYPLRNGDQLRLGKLRIHFYYLLQKNEEVEETLT